MYSVEKCDDQFWCLLDVQTTMPPLLSLRWLESVLLEKKLGTQKSYLDSLKLFYDFWLVKFGVSLDYSFHRSKYADVESMVCELDAFWDYIIADKEITNVVLLPSSGDWQKSLTKKKRTAAKHCSVVCNFLQFLSDTYITPHYKDESPSELRRCRSAINAAIKEARERFNKFKASNSTASAGNSMRSLTPDQYLDFISVLQPDVMRPIKVTLPNGNVQIDWQLVKENKLNPINSFDVQMRNYLLTILLVKYGLRIGESLLLRKASFKKSEVSDDKWIMRVRNLHKDNLSDEQLDDVRNHKPQIKTESSIRDLYISNSDYKNLMTYYKFIRSEECKHDFIFSATVSPYNPVSYSTVKTQFNDVVDRFQKKFPVHFDSEYADAIVENITPHWLRHTWAYATMEALYQQLENKYIKSGVVSVKGIMEDVKDKLRVMGGWSEKSSMPAKYAKRFIQENANATLMTIYNNYKDNVLFDEEIPY
ncbi:MULTISPECIES: site-specific integrase [Vibrio]|uniref:site-specific integrase n=1 Tax=Vibrio TaxID=662 RepID=UPI001BD1E815|nr:MULTISPECIES: site-specific integrase [Vibrio]MBT0118285.1 site-specific integrase [Vibrio alginolyticus]MCG9235861.1 site-specific integrase [Vibrio harveyi]MCG9586080.1 site-specific integrase [Vibrio harveyi]NRB69761.1 site-specific integrase [Vibrio sp.]